MTMITKGIENEKRIEKLNKANTQAFSKEQPMSSISKKRQHLMMNSQATSIFPPIVPNKMQL